MEKIKNYLEEAKKAMEKAYLHTQETFTKVHAGRAVPNMLNGIMIEMYGNLLPINQVAVISVPDPRTLLIQPWEKCYISAIHKAIIDSPLGLTPQDDGIVIRLNIPPPTEERRKFLVKQVRHDAENGRVTIRTIRRNIKESLKRIQKDGITDDNEIKRSEKKLQEVTDSYINKIDTLLDQKEEEIMKV